MAKSLLARFEQAYRRKDAAVSAVCAAGAPRDLRFTEAAFDKATRFQRFIDAAQVAARWSRNHQSDFIRFHIQHDGDAWVVSFDHAGFSANYLAVV